MFTATITGTMKARVIAVDVDGVVADMFPVWLERYHRDHPDVPYSLADVYGDRAKRDLVFLSYLNDPTLYDGVSPIPGALEAIQELRAKGHRVVFVTSCVKGMVDGKWNWLQRHGFLPAGDFQADDLVIVHDKSLIRASALIDDLPKNVSRWGNRGILFTQPWNVDSTHMPRVAGWPEVIQLLRVVEKVCLDL